MWVSVVLMFVVILFLWIAVDPFDHQEGSSDNLFASFGDRLKEWFSSAGSPLPSANSNVNDEMIRKVEEEVFPDLTQ